MLRVNRKSNGLIHCEFYSRLPVPIRSSYAHPCHLDSLAQRAPIPSPIVISQIHVNIFSLPFRVISSIIGHADTCCLREFCLKLLVYWQPWCRSPGRLLRSTNANLSRIDFKRPGTRGTNTNISKRLQKTWPSSVILNSVE